MADVKVVIGQTDGGTKLTVRGELDAGAVGTLQACVAALEPGAGLVQIDLRDVTSIDADGIATLVRIHRHLEVELRRLEVSSARGQVRRVLEMSGATDILELA